MARRQVTMVGRVRVVDTGNKAGCQMRGVGVVRASLSARGQVEDAPAVQRRQQSYESSWFLCPPLWLDASHCARYILASCRQ